jgi:signal transduction histidine kinase
VTSEEGQPSPRDIVYRLVHELRTPITVAASHAELLVEAGDSFDAAMRTEMAGEIVAAMQRLSAGVDQLADLARRGGPLDLEAAEKPSV